MVTVSEKQLAYFQEVFLCYVFANECAEISFYVRGGTRQRMVEQILFSHKTIADGIFVPLK